MPLLPSNTVPHRCYCYCCSSWHWHWCTAASFLKHVLDCIQSNPMDPFLLCLLSVFFSGKEGGKREEWNSSKTENQKRFLRSKWLPLETRLASKCRLGFVNYDRSGHRSSSTVQKSHWNRSFKTHKIWRSNCFCFTRGIWQVTSTIVNFAMWHWGVMLPFLLRFNSVFWYLYWRVSSY